LVATALSLTIEASGAEPVPGAGETEATAVAAFLPGPALSVGQGLSTPGSGTTSAADEATKAEEALVAGAGTAAAPAGPLAGWERMALGLDEELEHFRRANPGGLSGAGAVSPADDRPESPSSPSAPDPDGPSSLRSAPDSHQGTGVPDRDEGPSSTLEVEAIDTAIESLWGEDARPDRPVHAPAAAAIVRVPIGSAVAAPSRGSAGAAPLPLRIIPEPGRDEPGLGSASLLIALLAAGWGVRRRSSASRRELI
jgi:hypothetical protein